MVEEVVVELEAFDPVDALEDRAALPDRVALPGRVALPDRDPLLGLVCVRVLLARVDVAVAVTCASSPSGLS